MHTLFLTVQIIIFFASFAHPAASTQPHDAPTRPAVIATPTIRLDAKSGGMVDSLGSKIWSYATSIISDLDSSLPGQIADGILSEDLDLPTGSQVLSLAGISSTDLDAIPTQVLNIPSYGNWTENGWNLRLRGNVYKQPDIAQRKIDDLANVFLIDTSIEKLSASQADQARNLTREIFIVQQAHQNVTMNIFSGPFDNDDLHETLAVPQSIKLPYETTGQGDFDVFVPLQNNSLQLLPGSETAPLQKLHVHAEGTYTGNATSYLVPEEGLTIVSDIDDILRVTKIYQPKEGLLNTFARPFSPWLNMPSIYHNWAQNLPEPHFHYLTTTPEQATRNYMQFIFDTYPGGTFDTRPLNFSDMSATLSIRKFLLNKIFQTFPKRKFILVADTSNNDVMHAYPEMAKQYPEQVRCIFLRNTSATDAEDKIPYNTKGFKDLNQKMYMFFVVPNDLTNLDIANGQCYNSSVRQNLTFGYQGLPFGLSTGDGDSASGHVGRSAATTTRWQWPTFTCCLALALLLDQVL